MRSLTFGSVCGVALAWAATLSQADVRSYCEAYARDQADGSLSGGAILGANIKLAPKDWAERKTLALADCLTLYALESMVEPVTAEPETVSAKPITTVRTTQKTIVTPKPEHLTATAPARREKSAVDAGALVAGGPAWKNYCATKHPSYNREADTYTSLSGKQRHCRITKSLAPAASNDDSPWDSFDNPTQTLSR